MQTPTIGSRQTATGAAGQNEALRDLNLEDFLKLMITELQNQDPLNPLDNAQILQQVSQISNIDATTKLSGTLDSVLLGQSVASASALIGKSVGGLTDAGDQVSGIVDRVSIEDGQANVHIGAQKVRLSNLEEIRPTNETTSG